MEVLSHNIAIVTAAGSGTRMGGTVKKQFRDLGGIPVFIRSVSVFMDSPLISGLIITAPEAEIDLCNNLLRTYLENPDKAWKVIPGGAERQDSIFGALQACPPDTDYVFIHDGVRPFITAAFLEELYFTVCEHQAVVPGAALKNTIKEVNNGFVERTLQRDHLMQIFTPQVFAYKLILEAYQRAYEDDFFCTDDASLIEHLGKGVFVLPSSELNLKITDETDWLLARLMIERNIH